MRTTIQHRSHPLHVRRVLMRLATLAVAALVSMPTTVCAEPQGNASLTVGAAGVGTDGEFWDHAEFHLGVRGDVLFGRERSSDFGAGPYLELGTFAFDELQFGGGGSVLLPIHDSLPLVASAGGFARIGDDDFGVEPGFAASLFWGSRSFNFHANYVIALGLSVGYRATFGDSRESALLVAAQLDLGFLGVPVVALVNLLRGPTDEARPIE